MYFNIMSFYHSTTFYINKKIIEIYEQLEQKQNGSNLFINVSKKLDNEKSYKNLHLFIGITGLYFILFYLARKKQINNL